jgi:ribosomal protein S18 acetylase RimI-like enzyme
MPTVRLAPMTEQQYTAYRSTSDEAYARSIASSGSMPLEEAREKSRDDFARLLPDGLASEGHRFWTAYDGDTEVGMVWVQLRPTSEGLTAFGYDFEVPEALRRSGYGRAIMAAAADELRTMGVMSVGLNVFGDNLGAQALYEQMGFEVTSIQMRKLLV